MSGKVVLTCCAIKGDIGDVKVGDIRFLADYQEHSIENYTVYDVRIHKDKYTRYEVYINDKRMTVKMTMKAAVDHIIDNL